MPYRFKLREDHRKGFRRIMREQIDLAVRELGMSTVPTSSVHAGRKAIKRLRALIRCAEPALGAKAARKHDQELRDIARLLSPRRDADVGFETIDKLVAHFGGEATAGLAPLKTQFEAQRTAASEALPSSELTDVRHRLAKAGKRLAKATLKGRGLTPYLEGIEKSYRDGCKALKTAYRAPSDEAVHDLRKAIQAHWRHMSLLSRAWPETFSGRVARARELSQLLGDDHDLAVIKAAAAAGTLTDAERSIICNLCERRQSELRDAAKSRAEQLYAERPDAFGRRMTAYWAAGKKIAPLVATIEHEDKAPGPKAVVARPGEQTGSPVSLAAKTPASTPSQRRS